MTFKEFAEQQTVDYVIVARINGEPFIQSTSYNLDTAVAGANHFDEIVGKHLQSEYENLYEDDGVSDDN